MIKYLKCTDPDLISEGSSEHQSKNRKQIPENIKDAKYIVHSVASESELDKFNNNDDFIIEQFVNLKYCTNEFWQKVANLFADYPSYNGRTIHFYTLNGKLMNHKYDLAGNNAYPDDLPMLVVPRSTYNGSSDYTVIKAKFKARYFSDVVWNNERREILAGRHKAK